jgi:tryptophan synthase alpha chain
VSNISSVFVKPGNKALIAYVTVGYPSIEATLKIVPLLAKSGCDIVELGIPFSDPLADGTTIQKASFHALSNGVTLKLCIDVARQLRQKAEVPLVMMSYFNPVYNYGCEDFCRDSADAGIDGLIIPDLPPEEGSDLEVATMKNNLDLVYLLAPTSNPNRIKLVANKSRGFIYLVSVTGTTGAREILPSGLDTFVSRVREIARQPLCVGFGISTPQQARQIATIADGIIVGSRIIQLMESSDDNFASVQDFIVELRNALDNPSAT